MCFVSMVGDFYSDKWRDPYKPYVANPIVWNGVSQADFDALKKEVLDMKELLKRALEYDKKNNEPNCEIEDKVVLLKKVAELVGVSLDDIFKK